MIRNTILGLVAGVALITAAVAPASAHYYGGYGYKSYYKPYYGHSYGYKSYGYGYKSYGYKSYYGGYGY
jgi:hypothetical protein